jgi:histidinol-phosphate aminotransferase
MGLLDYYRQFEDLTESEVNAELRERRAQDKALALEQVPVLDLSATEWPELPSADVVGASVYQARGRLNAYPDTHAAEIRRLLAERHCVRINQIALGNGALELMQTAIYLLLSDGDEVVLPWPSYRLYPSMAAKAGARTVPVDLVEGAFDVEAVRRAVGPRSHVVVICNPNDPTGCYLDSESLGTLLSALPAHVHVLLDEAFIQFQSVEAQDAGLRLVEAFPNLLVFRTFSKAFGLSGIRAGYVVGSPASSELIGAVAPALGVNQMTQAAVAQALKLEGDVIVRRDVVVAERERVLAGVERLGLAAASSQASFVWIRARGMSGEELASRLEKSRVLVAAGEELGDDEHIRVAIRDRQATDRFLWALEQAVGQ